ncbi:hypothetical protein B0H17DRAFT_484246 [Mycena rosella]|uniref:Uncharacterized protein n=1 Tax=Mycena rosella TaxID=1033263 RepID=A0AAD7C3K8_MYCRO|nr:hypothetical protein B0H17DRAFT_484246 [Mycena rosella]
MSEPADSDDVGDGPAESTTSSSPATLSCWSSANSARRKPSTAKRPRSLSGTSIQSSSSTPWPFHSSTPSSPPVPILVTGQPGIGKSVGAHYFLLYLLGLGKPVFWVQEYGAYYFNAHGVQHLSDPNGLPNLPVVHRALQASLVAPAVVKDDSGRRLVREDLFTEFLPPDVAAKTCELAESRMHRIQHFLSRAFDVSSTRGVAGRLVEGLMDAPFPLARQPTSGRPRQRRGGRDPRAPRQRRHLRPQSVPTTARPLYLRPLLVDAMVATTDTQLGLLQTSLADTHSKDFGTMLGIIARLPHGAGIEVAALDDMVYCVVGSTAHRVRDLVRAARATLAKLQTF